jgi:hypothetical protein
MCVEAGGMLLSVDVPRVRLKVENLLGTVCEEFEGRGGT